MGSRALPRLAFLLGTLGLAVLLAGGAARPTEAADAAMYGDALASGWQNWSWGSTVDLAATPGYNGSSRAISWRVTQAWGGLYLHTDTGIPTNASTRLQFALRASTAGQRYRVGLYDDAGNLLGNTQLADLGGDPPAGSWKLYDVGLSALGAAGKGIRGFQLQDAENSTQPLVLVDAVRFVAVGAGPPTAATPTATRTATPAATPTATPGAASYSAELRNVSVAGADVSADVTLRTTRPGTVLVDLLAYRNGAKVAEVPRRGVANGQTVRLTIPNLPTGTYQLTVGLFTDDADWEPLLAWLPNLATAVVGPAAATPTPTPPPAADNLVPNPSVEQPAAGNPAVPASWATVRSGDHDARFSYLTSGRSGSRSLRIDLTRRTSGAAAWTYAPRSAVAGQVYRIAHFYKSDASTRAEVVVRKADGTTQYVPRKTALPSAEWASYVDSFIVPADAVALAVHHLIDSVGYLVTDDYSLTAYTPRPFSRALATITFDDGFKSQAANAWPLLRSYGMPATFFITTGLLGASAEYLTPADVTSLAREGAHIASHTITHRDLTTLSAPDVQDELSRSRAYLEGLLGAPVADFAAPYGKDGGAVLSRIRQTYRSERGVVPGYNLRDTLDPHAIQVQNIERTTTEGEVRAWARRAARDRSWLVLVYHRVDTGGDPHGTTPQAFGRHLQILRDEGLAVAALDQALRETTAQP